MDNSSINKIYDSVVRIEANMIQFDWTVPFIKSQTPTGSGSGFLIDDKGHIVTCFHVINQAVHLFVTLPKSGQKRIPASIVSIFPEMDIAVIKINLKDKTSFLEIGDSDKIKIGKEVLAIGYPLGQEKLKITKGIVSGIQNTFIQIDASINPGNSGGPLLYDGKVIAINTAKIVQIGTEGIGYANPINIFSNLKKRMFSKPTAPISSENSSIVSYIKNDIVRIESSSLGILVDNCTKELMEYYGTACPTGIQMTRVFDNSPLKIGEDPAKDGDILCKIEEFEIDNTGECTVPWNREKVNYNEVFDRLALTQYSVTLEYYSIEEETQKGGFIINNITDWLKNITSTRPPPNIHKIIGKKVKKTVPIVPTKSIFKIWKLYPPYDEVKYVAFGGIVMMNLSMNHIMMKNFQHLFYNYINKLDHNVVIITKILPSSVRIDDILEEGNVVSEINGMPIEKIEDVEEALKKPIYRERPDGDHSCYFTLKTGLNTFYSIRLKKIIQEDVQLFQYLNYEPSEATKYFIKYSDSEPCLNESKQNSNTNTEDHIRLQ